MRFVVSTALIALSSVFQAGLVCADDALNFGVSEAFEFAGKQLAALKENRLTDNNLFISYTNQDGEWFTVKENGDNITKTVWTSGMVAGMFWYQYEATGDSIWKDYAEDTQVGLEGVELLDDNDLGFQTLNSFGNGYRLVGTEAFKSRVFDGARMLFDSRYVENIPAFWSWANPSRRPEWERAVNIDMIMNMEIMLWATENEADDSDYYREAVAGHAETTWKDLVRDDYSTFHVADYNTTTGDLVDRGTYQGWMDNSTWSRGQAWSIYGFTMVYRFMRDRPIFFEYATNLLEYFDTNLPDDNVPYADFDAPLDADNPKDSSSTAIVGSALFEMFDLTGNPDYLEKAQTYLSSLLHSPTYFDPEATDGWEALLRMSASEHGPDEGGVGSVTGDYFLLENMVRYMTMAPSILLRNEDEVSISDGLSAVFPEFALDNDIDISGLCDDTPVMIWFGVTLSNTDFFPDEISMEGMGGSTTIAITEPAGGWETGTNTVSFSIASGTLSMLDTVAAVTLSFASSTSDSTTDVKVDYLVVGHRINTSLKTCSDGGGACSSPGDCCTGTCTDGTCTDSGPPYTHLGCYADEGWESEEDRALDRVGFTSGNHMSIERCAEYCTELGFRYMGLQYGKECDCGSDGDEDMHKQYGLAECNSYCTGDPDEYCGGFWAFDYYDLA
eukprot:g1587.t1